MPREDDSLGQPQNGIVRGAATFPVQRPEGTTYVTVPVNCPPSIRCKGKTFYQTGKLGHRAGDQAQVAEYEAVDGEGRRTGERVWLLDDGTVRGE